MRPRIRTVRNLVAGLGLLAVAVLMLKPVHAGFDDDPLLRLQAFDRPVGSLPTEVDCGAVLSSIRSPSSPASLYTLARDEACRNEGYQRLLAAIGAACALVVLSLLLAVETSEGAVGGMAGASWERRPRRERPPRPVRSARPERGSEDHDPRPESPFKANAPPAEELAEGDSDAGADPDAEPYADDADDGVPALTPGDGARSPAGPG